MAIFLTEIEVQGFKSFANKTGFHFPAMIVGVVGPNGSGKSNIVDALRWVLGERAAKHLRGESLGNLIFSGTPKKPAAGLARVALRFNNSARHFPFDTEEVVIERRIDRSGNSQFFVNSAETRFRELGPIFARAKMGTRGLTIIGQGQSDLFVKSSPEERRIMIEEILGLKEFRLKKQEAERQLENGKGNMERVRLIIEELAPRLGMLRKQKTRWNKRSEIGQELRGLEERYFGHSAARIAREMEETLAPIGALEEKRRQKEKEAQVLEQAIGKIENDEETDRFQRLRKKKSKLADELHATERDLIRLETRLEMRESEQKAVSVPSKKLERFARDWRADLRRAVLLDNLAEIKRRLMDWLSALDRIFEAEPKRDQADHGEADQIKKLGEKAAELRKEVKGLEEEEEKIQAFQREAERRFRDEFQRVEKEKNAARELEREIQNGKFAVEKIKMREEELRNLWFSLGKKQAAWAELVLRARGRGADFEAPTGDALGEIQRIRGELSAIGEIEEDVLRETDETEARYNFLVGELNDLQAASEDLGKVVEKLDRSIHKEFRSAFQKINSAFNNYFGVMFGGGRARMMLSGDGDGDDFAGVEIEVTIPRKKIKSLDMLSGGEKSLVSMAALFALVSTSAPPFLVLDEIDAALDEDNARRFAELIKQFSEKTQFLIVTHNRITMETADVLYGVTMADDGVSKVLSLELEKNVNLDFYGPVLVP